MFDRLKYSKQLRRLQTIKRKVGAAYRKDILDAKKAKKVRSEIASIEQSEMFEISVINDEISQLESQELLRQAEYYRISRPKDSLERSEITGYWCLKSDVYEQLRKAIRNEKKERWELRMLWVPAVSSLVTALTGLAGIITGLVAVLGK